MARKWVRSGVLVFGLSLVAVGVWMGANWNELQTKYAVHRMTSASTDEERAKWAEALAARGSDGPHRLAAMLKTSQPTVRTAAVASLRKHLEDAPAGDSPALSLALELLDVYNSVNEDEREALTSLLPLLVQRTGSIHTAKCREAVAATLRMKSVEARLAAIRSATEPRVAMRAELISLLAASEAEVRRAVLFAIGPQTEGEAVLGDEDLFRWMHDSDADVRKICRAALVSRGRSDGEISLGRKLVDPDAAERLKLLLDLRYDDDFADPEPWLQRLSQDADPGVRAGAARVIMELNGEKKLPAPGWVLRLAESDPDPTVRRIAKYYRSQPSTAADEGIRLIGGP